MTFFSAHRQQQPQQCLDVEPGTLQNVLKIMRAGALGVRFFVESRVCCWC